VKRLKIGSKTARAEHLCKLIENNQNNPRFLFDTVARLTNKQTSPEQNIALQYSNNFMNFFTEKIESIRNTIVNVQSFMVSYDSDSNIAPQYHLHRFTAFIYLLSILFMAKIKSLIVLFLVENDIYEKIQSGFRLDHHRNLKLQIIYF